jgi:3-hydroxyisobutyrate dehydrogenase-like beta-hydroxyacid dehydrogenase
MNVGFIGLGKMGLPMAKNLIRAGYKINIYDKNPSAFKSLTDLGGYKHNSIKDIGTTSDCIFLMVYPQDEVFEVIFDENSGLIAGIKDRSKRKSKRDTIIIDGGNADYIKSRMIGQRLCKLGIHYMDVGLSGGPEEAEMANLAAFVGGNRDVFDENLLPLLSVLCNKEKIHYVGKLGLGHFTKVVAHNTMEYGIMGIIGEIASLSNEVGDHRKIMMAVNSGIAQTRLGELYLQLIGKDIENTGCKIDVTQNAAQLALREAKIRNIGMPLITTIYYLRQISKELFETDNISDATRNNLIEQLQGQLDMLIQEYKSKGTIRSMAIQAQLRKTFGRHSVYERKSRGQT